MGAAHRSIRDRGMMEDVLKRTDSMVTVEACHRAWARFLSEVRTASNDDRRASRSDRSRFNAQVDLLGALGALFLLRAAQAAKRSEEAVAYMRDGIVMYGRPRCCKGETDLKRR